jgi:hypothetical protein
VRWRRRECGAARVQPGVDGGDAAARTAWLGRGRVRRGEATSAARSGGGRLSGRTRVVPTAPLRHGVGTWQPCGDGALTGGPSAGSGG